MENVKSAGNVKTPIVPIVANECHRAETAVNGTAQTPAEPMPIGNVMASGISDFVTPTSTKRHTTVTRPCQQCGREMVVRRPSKRFCGAACRRAAWLASNPEKAAALAEGDKSRLRAHLENRGIVWVEQ